jgi:hypothetical protein
VNTKASHTPSSEEALSFANRCSRCLSEHVLQPSYPVRARLGGERVSQPGGASPIGCEEDVTAKMIRRISRYRMGTNRLRLCKRIQAMATETVENRARALAGRHPAAP